MSEGIKIKTSHILFFALAIILLMAFGVISFKFEWGGEEVTKKYVAPDGMEFDNYWDYYNYYIQHWGEPPEEKPPAGRDAAKIQFGYHNAITDASVSGGNSKLDITRAKDGVINFLTKSEQVDVGSASKQSALYYAEGDVLILHCSSDTDPTGGTDHYDGWYYVTLKENNPVRKFTPNILSVASKTPTYTYTISGVGDPTGYAVHYTAGTTPYWDLGILNVWPRISSANLDTYLKYSGATLASVTDGSSWVDTNAEITANATFTTTSEDLYIELVGGAVDLCYGLPQYVITQAGEIQERDAVIIITTSMTSIGAQSLYDEGWQPLSKVDLTAEIAYYKPVSPMIPARGTKLMGSIKIPVDSSAATASTAYLFKVWLMDMQVPAYVAQGSTTTSIPTAYGFIGEYGIDAVIHGTALTVSSGAGTTEQLRAYGTTPS